MSTAASRAAWLGWVNAGGSRRMALRPNSIWREYSGLPFVFSNQWLLDVQWCARHGLIAADFDALTGDWQAVGPSYYALARLLWNPSTLSIPDILTEYYSAFGGAADAMRRYYTFWQQHLQAVNTDPAVLQRMQEVAVTRSQYVLAGQTYNAGILTTAAALLAHAQATCGSTAQSPSCVRVGKAATQLEYTRRVAAAASATAAVIRPQTDADNQWTEPVGSNVTVPAGAIVHAGRALQRMATDIAGHSITNVYVSLVPDPVHIDLAGGLALGLAPGLPPGLPSGLVPNTWAFLPAGTTRLVMPTSEAISSVSWLLPRPHQPTLIFRPAPCCPYSAGVWRSTRLSQDRAAGCHGDGFASPSIALHGRWVISAVLRARQSLFQVAVITRCWVTTHSATTVARTVGGAGGRSAALTCWEATTVRTRKQTPTPTRALDPRLLVLAMKQLQVRRRVV